MEDMEKMKIETPEDIDKVFDSIKEDVKEKFIEKERRHNAIVKLALLLEEIKKWNAETFKTSPLHGQLAKLEEEMQEFHQAIEEDDIEKGKAELADIFIVLGGLMRWNSKVGVFIKRSILDDMPAGAVEELISDIEKKMEINKERTAKGVWKVQPDGSSHH